MITIPPITNYADDNGAPSGEGAAPSGEAGTSGEQAAPSGEQPESEDSMVTPSEVETMTPVNAPQISKSIDVDDDGKPDVEGVQIEQSDTGQMIQNIEKGGDKLMITFNRAGAVDLMIPVDSAPAEVFADSNPLQQVTINQPITSATQIPKGSWTVQNGKLFINTDPSRITLSYVPIVKTFLGSPTFAYSLLAGVVVGIVVVLSYDYRRPLSRFLR